MLGSLAFNLLWTQVAQVTIVWGLIGGLALITSKRFPHFAFLLLMLAFAKCLTPPVISSPTGLFSHSEALALQGRDFEEMHINTAKQEVQRDRDAFLHYFDAPEVKKSIPAARSTVASKNWLVALVVVWAAGVIFLLWRSMTRLRRVLDEIQRNSQPASVPLMRIVRDVKRTTGVQRFVRVRVSEDDIGPGCIGVFRPTLVLPRVIVDQFPDHLLRPIIAHELTHIRRGDVIWGCLQYVCQIVWWFHPLVWWLGVRANRLCEMCVDFEVANAKGSDAGTYGESLVKVLEYKSHVQPLPAARQLSAAQLTRERLERLTTCHGSFTCWSRRICWVSAFLLGAVLLPGMSWSIKTGADYSSSLSKYRDELIACFRAHDLDRAATLLEKVCLQRERSSGIAQLLLGCVYENQNRYTEAKNAFGRAAKLDESLESTALFNAARVLAVEGRDDECIEHLNQARRKGFIYCDGLENHPAFQSIRGDPGFIKVADYFERAGENYFIEQASGSTTEGTVALSGSTTAAARPDGQVLVPQWSIQTDKFGDPEIKFWIDAEGRITEVRDIFLDDGFQSVASRIDVLGNRSLQRRILKEDQIQVHRIVETSDDGGETWRTRLHWRMPKPKPLPKLRSTTGFEKADV